ncbi:MAG: alpha/beta fold hydrolase [bacterium]|nr:alpha/beta fold hydrolase [bacterium]
MNNVFIQNRHSQKLAVVVEEQEGQKGLAFVMHGQGGFKEQPHVRTFIEAFMEKGFTVVSFDAANTIGESGGNMEYASITSYYEDLEDVIHWAQSQEWYQEPFTLAGHSLGGICTALYAEHHPEKVLGLAPISTVVSGTLSWETHPKEELDEWKRTGWRVSESKSKPGVIKKLKWKTMEDRLKYDLLEKADKLTMPVLLIVGDGDTTTPLAHQKLLFDALPGKKELHVIPGAAHTFRDPKHLEAIQQHFLKWIDAL